MIMRTPKEFVCFKVVILLDLSLNWKKSMIFLGGMEGFGGDSKVLKFPSYIIIPSCRIIEFGEIFHPTELIERVEYVLRISDIDNPLFRDLRPRWDFESREANMNRLSIFLFVPFFEFPNSRGEGLKTPQPPFNRVSGQTCTMGSKSFSGHILIPCHHFKWYIFDTFNRWWLNLWNCKIIKFIYSEKAAKFCEIFTLLLSYVVPVKSKVKIFVKFCGLLRIYEVYDDATKRKIMF